MCRVKGKCRHKRAKYEHDGTHIYVGGVTRPSSSANVGNGEEGRGRGDFSVFNLSGDKGLGSGFICHRYFRCKRQKNERLKRVGMYWLDTCKVQRASGRVGSSISNDVLKM